VKHLSLSFALLCSALLASANPALAEPKTGVVVMHGKWDAPDGWMLSFANNLKSTGHLVATPEMLWSGRREYDADVATMENEISAAVKSLKDQGAQKICVAGHSLGGVGALYYATRVKVDCVIAISPGPYPAFPKFQGLVKSDLSKAKDMVAKGQGDDKAWFNDLNSGARTKSMRIKARIFVEQNDAGGPMDPDRIAGQIQANTPVLVIYGKDDAATLRSNCDAAFAKIPASVPKKFVEVPGDHLHTPSESMSTVTAWLSETVK